MNEAQFAEQLARWMHRSQVDKCGRPYVEHLERVAAAVSDEAKAAAWLHDVCEDTPMSRESLLGMFSLRTAATVYGLTRARDYFAGYSYAAYIERIAHGETTAHRLAREVKIADLKDNLSDDRRYEGDESLRERYQKALEILERKGEA